MQIGRFDARFPKNWSENLEETSSKGSSELRAVDAASARRGTELPRRSKASIAPLMSPTISTMCLLFAQKTYLWKHDTISLEDGLPKQVQLSQ
jgi:hypothetical protein